jgi:ribosomal protein L39E
MKRLMEKHKIFLKFYKIINGIKQNRKIPKECKKDNSKVKY